MNLTPEQKHFTVKLAVVITLILILVLYAYRRSQTTLVYMVGVEKMISEDVKRAWTNLKSKFGSRLQENYKSYIKRRNEGFTVDELPILITVRNGKIIAYGRPDSVDAVEKFVHNAFKFL